MRPLSSWLIDRFEDARSRFETIRDRRRWQRLRQLGMRIGSQVNLPASTWVDVAHCFLIAIGDRCTFGDECLILAHDAQMDEFLDAGRVGRVEIHDQCDFGPRCVILCDVEVGPRTVVGPASVVVSTLPPDSYCAGAPARVVSSLADYLATHRAGMATRAVYPYADFERLARSPAGRAELEAAIGLGGAYVRRASERG